MTTALLFISIVLNIVALFSIVILYLRQTKLFEVEKKQRKIIEEMEDVISTYLAEMKEENENFIQRLSNNNKARAKESFSDLLPNRETAKVKVPSQGIKNHAVKAYQSSAVQRLSEEDVETLLPEYDELDLPGIQEGNKEEKVTNIPEIVEEEKKLTLLEEVLDLHDQGLSNEEIARKLHKGQTEIELLLKFRQNNQE